METTVADNDDDQEDKHVKRERKCDIKGINEARRRHSRSKDRIHEILAIEKVSLQFAGECTAWCDLENLIGIHQKDRNTAILLMDKVNS
jgi:hypothetical protein